MASNKKASSRPPQRLPESAAIKKNGQNSKKMVTGYAHSAASNEDDETTQLIMSLAGMLIQDHYKLILSDLSHIRQEMNAEARSYEDKLYQRIAETCRIGAQFRDDKDLWSQFCGDPFWEKMERGRPTEDCADEAVRYALKFVCGTGRYEKNASLYWRAVGPLLKAGHRPDELPELIKKASVTTEDGRSYGLRALAKRHASKDSFEGVGQDNPNSDPPTAVPRRSTSGSSRAEDVSKPVHKEGRDERADHVTSAEGQTKMAFDLLLSDEAFTRLRAIPRGNKGELVVIVERMGSRGVLRVLDVSPVP